MTEKFQYFNGRKYTRDEKTGYYLNSTHRQRIHRAVWEFYNGSIPSGFAIHHIDGDKSNNRIENLMLINSSEHATYHGTKRASEHYLEMAENLEKNARPKATEWHRSDAGREWHSAHGKTVAEKQPLKKCVCEECGKEYYTKKPKQSRFCSNACKAKSRRKSGVDNEKRVCIICGKEFEVAKFSQVKTCGRSCGNKMRHAKKCVVQGVTA